MPASEKNAIQCPPVCQKVQKWRCVANYLQTSNWE